jgi:hypothetical protein
MDNNKMRWRDGIDLYGSITIPINQWVHLAWTKSGSTCRCWQQGVQVLSITESFDYTPTQYAVGTRGSFPSSIALFAYLSELRLTKGVARYSSNFTPPLSFFS